MPSMQLLGMLFVLVAVVASVLRLRVIAIPCGALALGGGSYFFLGVFIPRYLGTGRFYSVPFGRWQVGDWDIVLSVFFWMALWGLVLDRLWKRFTAGHPD